MLKIKILFSKYLDLLTTTIISYLLSKLLIYLNLIEINWFSIIWIIGWLGKDLFFINKSIWKKIFNLQITHLNSNKPNKIVLILRNLFNLSILDDILILLRARGISDYIFKTNISPIEIKKNYELSKRKIDIVILLISIIMLYIISNFTIANIMLKYNKYYDKIELNIPDGCKLISKYKSQNDFLYSRKIYRAYKCNDEVDLKNWNKDLFINQKNTSLEKKINIWFDDLNLEENQKKFFKNTAKDILNSESNYNYYIYSNLSNTYVIKSNESNKIFIIETTK